MFKSEKRVPTYFRSTNEGVLNSSFNKEYLKRFVEYVSSLYKNGRINKEQFSAMITYICSNFVENEVSIRVEEKLENTFYHHFHKIKFPL